MLYILSPCCISHLIVIYCSRIKNKSLKKNFTLSISGNMNRYLIATTAGVLLLMVSTLKFTFYSSKNSLDNPGLIADPHLGKQSTPHTVWRIVDHPQYDIIMRCDILNFFLDNKSYCCVQGGSESSDINSLLYLIYSDLRNTDSDQYKCFLGSVIDANIAHLKNWERCNREVEFGKAKEVFLSVEHFVDLSPDQLDVLHRCFSFMTASYIVENAGKMVFELRDPTGNYHAASRDELMVFADKVLCGDQIRTNIRLLAAQEKLNLDIACIEMTSEYAKYSSLPRYGDKISDSSEKRKVLMFMYKSYVFSPIFG